MRSFFRLVLLPILPVAIACSSDTSSNGVAHQSCKDLVEAFAKVGTRCGFSGNLETARAEAEKALGGCGSIVAVRDEGALRLTCVPSLSTISCTDFSNGVLHPTCKGQLLKNRSEVVGPSSPLVGLVAD